MLINLNLTKIQIFAHQYIIQIIINHLFMKKIPSYPKILSKTNITVTQTQNININSPKNIQLALPLDKKTFKIHKSNTQKDITSATDIKSNNHINSKSKIKTIYYSNSNKQINNRRQSSGNLNKISKIYNSKQDDEDFKDKDKGIKQNDYKKIEQKLKQLEKKIDTLKPSKSSSKKQLSHKTLSKIKDKEPQSNSNVENKSILLNFSKKYKSNGGSGSSSKIIKKCQSDKYLLGKQKQNTKKNKKDIQFNNSKQNHQKQLDKQQQQQQQNSNKLINNFITQMSRNQPQQKKLYKKNSNSQIPCYYIQNLLESMYKHYLMHYKQHLIQSIQTMKYLANSRKPTQKQIERQGIALPPSKFKYSLILDLDETLIHCNQNLSLPHDVTLKIKFPTGQKIDAGVNIRPYAIQLLKQLSKYYQIIIFTASHQCYANVVLDHIDPKNQYISHKLFRTNCYQTQQGIYIKDLRIFKNRSLQNILLVDNAAYSYFYQLQNGIPIIPFYDDKQDQQLLHLISYMKSIIKMKQNSSQSLREINNKYFQLGTYGQYQDLEFMVNKLYKENIIKFKKYIEK